MKPHLTRSLFGLRAPWWHGLHAGAPRGLLHDLIPRLALGLGLGLGLLASPAVPVRAAPLQSADIIDQFIPSQPFRLQPWGVAQCYGLFVPSANLPETGINGTPLPLGGTLRFGRAPDPTDPGRATLRMTLMPDDPLTAGAPRCETTFSPGATGLPIGRVFWHAFAIHIPDWRRTTDEQQLMQWHAGDTTGLQPIYSLLLRGAQMRLILRYDTSATPSRTTTVTRVLWSTNSWPPNTWITVVTRALVSTDPAEGPRISTWINGQPVVNYTGPVGYRTPTAQPYVKHGLYHWTNLNPWDLSLPQRTVHFRRAVLVADPRGLYSPADLATHVNLP